MQLSIVILCNFNILLIRKQVRLVLVNFPNYTSYFGALFAQQQQLPAGQVRVRVRVAGVEVC